MVIIRRLTYCSNTLAALVRHLRPIYKKLSHNLPSDEPWCEEALEGDCMRLYSQLHCTPLFELEVNSAGDIALLTIVPQLGNDEDNYFHQIALSDPDSLDRLSQLVADALSLYQQLELKRYEAAKVTLKYLESVGIARKLECRGITPTHRGT